MKIETRKLNWKRRERIILSEKDGKEEEEVEIQVKKEKKEKINVKMSEGKEVEIEVTKMKRMNKFSGKRMKRGNRKGEEKE